MISMAVSMTEIWLGGSEVAESSNGERRTGRGASGRKKRRNFHRFEEMILEGVETTKKKEQKQNDK